MKTVGVSSKLAELFYEQEFVLALSLTANSRFAAEKDDLIDYWISWLQDADFQLSGWLTLATCNELDTTTLSITTLNNRRIKMSVAKHLELTKKLGKTIYPILCGCPFLTTYRSVDSENCVNNLLGWAAAQIPATQNTPNGNYILFRELQPEVVELTMRLLQLVDLTRNRIQIAACCWGLGHLQLNTFL